MREKTIKAIKMGIFMDGNIRVAVDAKDCPYSSKAEDSSMELELYGDQNKNNESILTRHCYDTQPTLRPVVGSTEVKCPNFRGCKEGLVYCKLNK